MSTFALLYPPCSLLWSSFQCKRNDPRSLVTRYTPEAPPRGIPDVTYGEHREGQAKPDAEAKAEAEAERIVAAADVLGRWIQLDCAGFLTNKRQVIQNTRLYTKRY